MKNSFSSTEYLKTFPIEKETLKNIFQVYISKSPKEILNFLHELGIIINLIISFG